MTVRFDTNAEFRQFSSVALSKCADACLAFSSNCGSDWQSAQAADKARKGIAKIENEALSRRSRSVLMPPCLSYRPNQRSTKAIASRLNERTKRIAEQAEQIEDLKRQLALRLRVPRHGDHPFHAIVITHATAS